MKKEDYINNDEEQLLDEQKFTDQNASVLCVIDENSVEIANVIGTNPSRPPCNGILTFTNDKNNEKK